MKNKNYYRHGDLSFHPIEKLPEGLKKVKHKGKFVLALGEHTGHKHVITASRQALEILQDDTGKFYLNIKAVAKVSHEEHDTITFAPGFYQMEHEREFDYFLGEVARVQD